MPGSGRQLVPQLGAANCVINYVIGKLIGRAPYFAATIWRHDGLRIRLPLWTRVDYMIVEAHPCAEGSPHELGSRIADQGCDVKVKELGNGCLEFYCRHK